MKRIITFWIFAVLAFLALIALGIYMVSVEKWIYENFTISMLRSFWIPYIFMAVSGVFAFCAIFVSGGNRKETLGMAVSSLAAGILMALFTILAVKMKIRLTAFSDMTAVIWSDNCARPSMAIAGVLFANAVRHFIDAKKYNE